MPAVPQRDDFNVHPRYPEMGARPSPPFSSQEEEGVRALLLILEQAVATATPTCTVKASEKRNWRWRGVVYLYSDTMPGQTRHISDPNAQLRTPGLVLVAKNYHGFWEIRHPGFSNARSQERYQAELEQKKKTAQREAQREDQVAVFTKKHGIKDDKAYNPRDLGTNPFAYKGQTLLLNGQLMRMDDADRGVFAGIGSYRFAVSGIPNGTLKPGGAGRGMIAGVVLGNIKDRDEAIPHLRFKGSLFCSDAQCTRFEER
jgi:hypothetical protein